MKPLYLVDECCNMKQGFESEGFVQSTDIIGAGAPDEAVFELAKELQVPVITNDMKFALRMLIENYPVVFKRGGKTYFMKADVEEDPKFSGAITFHLLNSDTVVLP